ncbi:hypothetical protein SD78_0081 [Bacillus badius]|nr:hypothetical protein SD78_0081 [Bacillus badius]
MAKGATSAIQLMPAESKQPLPLFFIGLLFRLQCQALA